MPKIFAAFLFVLIGVLVGQATPARAVGSIARWSVTVSACVPYQKTIVGLKAPSPEAAQSIALTKLSDEYPPLDAGWVELPEIEFSAIATPAP
jgi:hypothetical protein